MIEREGREKGERRERRIDGNAEGEGGEKEVGGKGG